MGKGRTIEQVLGDMKQVAEGVKTAKSARDLAAKSGVELPICQQVYLVTHEAKSPRAAVVELMSRSPKNELM